MTRLLSLLLALAFTTSALAQSLTHPTKAQRLDWCSLDSTFTPGHDWTQLLALQHETVRMYGTLQQDKDGTWRLVEPLPEPTLSVELVLAKAPPTADAYVELEGILHLETPVSGAPQARLTAVKFLPASAPITLAWDTLDFFMNDVYFPELECLVWQPEFEPHQLALDGQRVSLTGHAVYIDPSSGFWILAENTPSFGCCGMMLGDPDSFADVRYPEQNWIPTNELEVTVTGRLLLNSEDVYAMNYILLVDTITLPDGSPLKKKHKTKVKDR